MTAGNLLMFVDQPSAEAAAGLLRAEGIPAEVEIQSPLPGLVEGVRVVVPEELERRARAILESADIPEGELTFMATGERDDDAESDPQ